MRNKFDEQLHRLEEQLTSMGELCETAIAKATQALKDGNMEQAKIIIEEDEEIDQLEKDIERLCLRLVLQQQPVAKDLRRISGRGGTLIILATARSSSPFAMLFKQASTLLISLR